MHRPPLGWEAAGRRKLPGSIEARVFGWIRCCLARRGKVVAFAQDSPFEVLPCTSEKWIELGP
jgi:hypothetical protein